MIDYYFGSKRGLLLWLRDPAVRDFALLAIIVAAFSLIFEPASRPVLPGAIALLILLGHAYAASQLADIRSISPARYTWRTCGWAVVGGGLVGGFLAMGIGLSIAWYSPAATANTFAIGLPLGGLAVGLAYGLRRLRAARGQA